ncbi:MAG: winged helix-turn-helix domain-containing protein [Nitrososphaerota archaeon]|nr:winged helix-turn-helix domain-containing protein [Candidatus Calditenuis fumarioli]
MRRAYRSRVRIYYDILNAVMSEGHARITTIMRDANLPYDRLQRYLEELVAKGLLGRHQNDPTLFHVTDKGVRFVEEFQRFDRLVRAFGLEI